MVPKRPPIAPTGHRHQAVFMVHAEREAVPTGSNGAQIANAAAYPFLYYACRKALIKFKLEIQYKNAHFHGEHS